MTTVARCFSIDQALFLRSVLESCNIQAYVPEELAAQSVFGGGLGDVRVQVEDEDAEAARAALKQNDLPFEGGE